jgi:hypothetical protein
MTIKAHWYKNESAIKKLSGGGLVKRRGKPSQAKKTMPDTKK